MKLDWNGELLAQVAERLVPAVDEIDMRIETRAKSELYPGHGKITGTLQRSIHTQRARLVGLSIIGAVGTEPLPYALEIHRRYSFLLIGFREVQPSALGIVERYARRK